MSPSIPVGTIHVEAFMTNPPTPSGYIVRAEGRTIAVLAPEDVQRAYEQYVAMRAVKEKSRG